jgi:hypothetical protein
MPSLSGPLFLLSPPSTSPLPGLILLLSIAGVFMDWRYRRAGGRPSSRRDKILFLSVVLLVAGTIATLLYLGYNPEILGEIMVPVAIWLFFAWELGRWRMRRKYPLPKQESSVQNLQKPE